jgi:hypothetical protein
LSDLKPWAELTALATHALEPTSPLKVWFDLGAAIGGYRIRLTRQDATEPLPSLKPILDLLRSKIADAGEALPKLQNLLHLAGTLDGSDPPALFHKVVALEVQGEVIEERVPVDALLMNEFLKQLDALVQDELSSLTTTQESGAQPQPLSTVGDAADGLKPTWVKEEWEIRKGDTLVKKFKREAPNAFRVLDAFQEEGWPSSILDPLPGTVDQGSDQQRRHDTIKSLNKHQNQIRFSGDGSGERFSWKWH